MSQVCAYVAGSAVKAVNKLTEVTWDGVKGVVGGAW